MIYADLRAQIMSLERRPGEPILESQIASAYGVSRTPVREAVLKLADEGLIEIFPQSGTFVARIPLAALPEAIVIRKSLEETSVRFAAQRASRSQIVAISAILERQREAELAGDREAFHSADEAFHAAIADAGGYPGIWKMVQQVKVHVDRYRRLTLPQEGRMARVIGEHAAIWTAIEAGDARRRPRNGRASRRPGRRHPRHPPAQSGIFRGSQIGIRVAACRHEIGVDWEEWMEIRSPIGLSATLDLRMNSCRAEGP